MPRIFVSFLLPFVVVLASCTKRDEPSSRYFLPWPTSSGENQFEIVTIETLSSPYEISGPAAQVFLQQALEPDGYSGEPMRPQLTLVGDVFYPLDVNSAIGLALYAHMERIFNLDQRLGVATRVAWPRQVGLEVLLAKSNSRAVEYDNARYFMDWDLTAYVPMSQQQTPLALNPGIIAHEHFHAHFQAVVGKQVPVKTDPTELELFNEQVVLRGWNEGLADYYGFVYSKNPDFLSMSLGESVGDERSFAKGESQPRRIRSAQHHFDVFRLMRTAGVETGGIGYAIGTDIARVLFGLVSVADESSQWREHESLMKWILEQLPRIGEFYLQQDPTQPIEPAAVLEILFQPEEIQLNQAQCEILKVALESHQHSLNWETKCLP